MNTGAQVEAPSGTTCKRLAGKVHKFKDWGLVEKLRIRGITLLLMLSATALAQVTPVAAGTQAAATVPSGVPLRVALERRASIKHVGEPVQARLVEPVYIFDHVVLPAGSVVLGHVAEKSRVPFRKRLSSILAGNLTPPRDVRVQFDSVNLSDGSRLSLHTLPCRGTEHTVRTTNRVEKRERHKSMWQRARNGLDEEKHAVIRAFKAQGKLDRLKTALLGMLPYHRQVLLPGTLFAAVLEAPLKVPAQRKVEARSDDKNAAVLMGSAIRARLITPVSSATARRGASVEAVITQPVFSSDHHLLIPERSRLIGEVVRAQPARSFHRNGKLNFVFRQVKLPTGTIKNIQGYLEGVEADFNAHLTLDSEGGMQVSSPKSRFIFPAVAGAVAGLSLHQDYNAQGVPDRDMGGRAEAGAVGLGLIGTVLAQTSRVFASGLAFSGAGYSIYSNFLARGHDVVLPLNTPVEVSLGSHSGGPGDVQLSITGDIHRTTAPARNSN